MRVLAIGLTSVLVAACLSAQEPRWEVAPFVLQAKPDRGFGAVLGYGFRAGWRAEVIAEWGHMPNYGTGSDITGRPRFGCDADSTLLALGGQRRWTGKVVSPFLAASAGVRRVRPDSIYYQKSDQAVVSAGGGGLVWPVRGVAIRIDGRVEWTDWHPVHADDGPNTTRTSDRVAAVFRIGLSFGFGATP